MGVYRGDYINLPDGTDERDYFKTKLDVNGMPKPKYVRWRKVLADGTIKMNGETWYSDNGELEEWANCWVRVRLGMFGGNGEVFEPPQSSNAKICNISVKG